MSAEMDNSKIQVSKELAMALDSIIDNYDGDKERLLNEHDQDWANDYLQPLNKLSRWDLAKILMRGYEIRETPEERVAKKYRMERELTKTNHENKWIHDAYANGIAFTLETLGIEIKGINK